MIRLGIGTHSQQVGACKHYCSKQLYNGFILKQPPTEFKNLRIQSYRYPSDSRISANSAPRASERLTTSIKVLDTQKHNEGHSRWEEFSQKRLSLAAHSVPTEPIHRALRTTLVNTFRTGDPDNSQQADQILYNQTLIWKRNRSETLHTRISWLSRSVAQISILGGHSRSYKNQWRSDPTNPLSHQTTPQDSSVKKSEATVQEWS